MIREVEVSVFVSPIPIPHTVELKIAHVVSFDLTYYFPSFLYLTRKVILSLSFFRIEIIVTVQLILFIMILHWSNDLMANHSHHNVVEHVVVVIVSDCLAVLKFYLLVS